MHCHLAFMSALIYSFIINVWSLASMSPVIQCHILEEWNLACMSSFIQHHVLNEYVEPFLHVPLIWCYILNVWSLTYMSPVIQCSILKEWNLARMSPLILVLCCNVKDANLCPNHTVSSQNVPPAAGSPPGYGGTTLLLWAAPWYRQRRARLRGPQKTPSGSLQAGTRSAAAGRTIQCRRPGEGPRHPPLSCTCNPGEWAPPAS